jgi:hypothetical protein
MNSYLRLITEDSSQEFMMESLEHKQIGEEIEKMSLHSAGILLFRFRNEKLEVMLVHPWWADSGKKRQWSVVNT